MRYLYIALIAAFLAGCGTSQQNDSSYTWTRRFPVQESDISFTISVDEDSITVDRTIHAKIELMTPHDIRAVLPDAENIPIDGFILRRSNTEPVETNKDGRDIQRVILTLEPMMPGEGRIGPIPLRYERREDNNWVNHTIMSSVATVTVLSLGVPEEGDIEFKDPRGTAHPRDNTILFYIAAGIILIGIMFIIYFIIMRKTGKARPVIPPHRSALRSLADLEKRDFIRRSEFRIFYSQLSEIMRRYIEESFGFSALEQTTREIMRDLLKNDRIEQDVSNSLRGLLEESDMVKFAKYRPSRDSAQECLYQGKAFIRATAPREDESE